MPIQHIATFSYVRVYLHAYYNIRFVESVLDLYCLIKQYTGIHSVAINNPHDPQALYIT